MKLNEQLQQEIEYNLPYHYIPRLGSKSFVENFRWSYSKQYISFLEFLLSEVIKYNKILEVGCGDGRIIGDIKAKFPSKICRGVDYSDKAISLARSLSPNVSFECINILEEDPKTHDEDLILLIEVFEHIPIEDCAKFAASLSCMQTQGSHLFITVPHLNVKVSKKHFQHFNIEKIMDYYGDEYTLERVMYLHSTNGIFSFIERIMFNRIFTITNEKILYYFYHVWHKHCFISTEQKCTRMFVHLIKK